MPEANRNSLTCGTDASAVGIEGGRSRVDEVNAEIAKARNVDIAAVEKDRIAGVVFGFIAASTFLVRTIAASFAATGRNHCGEAGLGFAGDALHR